MAACTFFGHRECPDSIKPLLLEKLEDLIINHDVDMFYVGNQGKFDAIVRTVLRNLSTRYSHIGYAVVLAYLPEKASHFENEADTMLPEGVESVHPRYAIAWRNNWMLRRSDYVVIYLTHKWGGAARFAEMAERQKKQIISVSGT